MLRPLAIGLALLTAPAALAQPSRPTARLETAGEPTCVTDAALRERVAAQLGYDPFVTDGALRAVRVETVAGDALIVRIAVTVDGADGGERELSGGAHECERLLDAATLAIAIAIDPTTLDRAPGEAPPEPPEPPEAPAAPPEPPVVPVVDAQPPTVPEPPLQPAPPRLRVSLLAHLTGSLGASPPLASVGGELGVELRYDGLSVALSARGDVPGRAGHGEGAVEGHVFGGALTACGRWEVVAFCAVATVGALRGSGDGFASDREVFLVYAGAGAGLGLDLPLSDVVAFRARADLLAHLTPAELLVDDAVAWAMPPVAGVLSAGVAVTVP